MSRARSVVIVLMLAVLGVSLTYLLERRIAPRIAAEQRAIASDHLLALLPHDRYDNQPLDLPLQFNAATLPHSTLLGGYLATLSGRPSAVLLRSHTVGYGGSVQLLIAIDINGKLLGVKTLKQSETPGLGAAIADWPNPWLQRLADRSTAETGENDWALKKDGGQFDQLVGATITSRAVVSAVQEALRYFDAHRHALLESPAHE